MVVMFSRVFKIYLLASFKNVINSLLYSNMAVRQGKKRGFAMDGRWRDAGRLLLPAKFCLQAEYSKLSFTK
jgi:hypothetical protein